MFGKDNNNKKSKHTENESAESRNVYLDTLWLLWVCMYIHFDVLIVEEKIFSCIFNLINDLILERCVKCTQW